MKHKSQLKTRFTAILLQQWTKIEKKSTKKRKRKKRSNQSRATSYATTTLLLLLLLPLCCHSSTFSIHWRVKILPHEWEKLLKFYNRIDIWYNNVFSIHIHVYYYFICLTHVARNKEAKKPNKPIAARLELYELELFFSVQSKEGAISVYTVHFAKR